MYLLRRSAAISQIHGTYISNAHGFGYSTATFGALHFVRAVDLHHDMARGRRPDWWVGSGRLLNYLCPQKTSLAGSFHLSLGESTERPQRNKSPQQPGTMMEGSSSSATAIEHGSEDAAQLIRPGGGGGVASTLPVDLERLGNVYVDSILFVAGLC